MAQGKSTLEKYNEYVSSQETTPPTLSTQHPVLETGALPTGVTGVRITTAIPIEETLTQETPTGVGITQDTPITQEGLSPTLDVGETTIDVPESYKWYQTKAQQGDQTALTKYNQYLKSRNEKPFSFDDKAVDEKPYLSGSNFGWKALDALGTLQQGIYGYITGDTVKGMKEDLTAADVLSRFGVEEGGYIHEDPKTSKITVVPHTGLSVMGFAIDVFTDPMIAVGMISRGLKVGSKIATGAQRILPKKMGGFRGVKDIVSVKKVMDITRKAKIKYTQRVRQWRNVSEIYDKKNKNLARDTNQSFGLFKEKVRKEAERPKASWEVTPEGYSRKERRYLITGDQIPIPLRHATSLTDEVDMIAVTRDTISATEETRAVAEAATYLNSVQDALQRKEILAGLQPLKLNSASQDYVMHAITDEAKSLIPKNKVSPELLSLGPIYKGMHSYQNLRKWPFTIDKVNDLGQQGKLPGMEGIVINQTLEDDPAKILFMSAIAREKAITDVEVFMDAAGQLGKNFREFPQGKVPAGLRQLAITESKSERIAPIVEKLKEYYFDPDVADHLDSYSRITTQGWDNAFFRTFDLVQNEWKALTLFPFPMYHFRNFVGNVWNNHLANIKPEFYKEATNYQRTSSNIPKSVLRVPVEKWLKSDQKVWVLNGVKYTKARLDKLMHDYGIRNQFEEFIDLRKVRMGAVKGQSMIEKGAYVENIPGIGRGVKLGMSTGNVIENNARVAHFMSKLDEGLTPMEAALSVKRYLFNYADLTPWEKATMKRAFPFYSWTRFNQPLQIRGIVDRPNNYASLVDIKNNIERQVEAPSDTDKLTHQFIKDNTSILTRINSDGHPEYFMLGGWLPAADIADIGQPFKTMIDNLGPWKIGAELALNRDSFTQQPIEGEYDRKTRFLGLDISKKAAHTIKLIRFLTEVDRFVAAAQHDLGLDQQFTSRKGDTMLNTAIRFFFGFKIYPVNLAQQRAFKKREIERLVNELKYDIQRKGGINKEQIRQDIKELQF